jgi:small nuclear ribonucleoprotein (snRNP)-like protein
MSGVRLSLPHILRILTNISAVHTYQPAAYAAKPVCESTHLPPHAHEFNMKSSVDNDVIIRLKWGQEYHGKLISVDSYMNIQMRGAEEWIDGKATGNLGEVLIRYAIFCLLWN